MKFILIYFLRSFIYAFLFIPFVCCILLHKTKTSLIVLCVSPIITIITVIIQFILVLKVKKNCMKFLSRSCHGNSITKLNLYLSL